MPNKITIATTWLQSCSGCHIAFLDLHEELLDVFKIVDIKYSPLVDIKSIPEVDVGIVEGAVANEENEEILREFRKKANKIIALGTCACFGGLPGMRNLWTAEEILKRGYIETESTTDGKIPNAPVLPKLKKYVKPIHQVIKTDAFISGCPPIPSQIKEGIIAVIEGRPIEAKTKGLCEACSRKKSKMLEPTRDFITDSVYSVHELQNIDPEICFLEQGVLCMGPATCEGCGNRCLEGNMPCRGCMGPTPDALEQGAKIINALSSILPAGALMFQEDIIGAGYRYSLPVSIYPHIAEERK